MDKSAWVSPPPAPAKKAGREGLRHANSACKWWLTGAVLAALALLGAAYGAGTPRYDAEARVLTDPRPGGGLPEPGSNATGMAGGELSQARLLASRDLARRVIKELAIADEREFDTGPDGLGAGKRALVLLGLRRDPARLSREDRVLEAFQERLRVSGPDRRGLLTIAFQSENPELAAKAANRLAELYIGMRPDSQKAPPAAARIVAFAVAPPSPVPGSSLLLTGASMAALAFGALVTLVLPRLPLHRGYGAKPAQPAAFGRSHAFARVQLNERLSQRITARPEPPPLAVDETAAEDPQDGPLIATAVGRIIAHHAHVRRGIRIVAPEPIEGAAGPYLAVGLARELAREGRAIAICLNGASLSQLGGAAGCQLGTPEGAAPLLGGLVAGRASFAEVICRDPCSRLHLLPLGQSGALDFHELQKIIDALAETYDYVVTMAPQIESDDTAKILAQESDFAILESPARAAGPYLAAEVQVIESSRGEVLLLGLEKGGPALARSAA